MKFGVGPRAGEIHTRLADAGQAVLAVAECVEQRFLRWPNGPSQEEVKELEHHADNVVSELVSLTNSTVTGKMRKTTGSIID